MTSNPEDPSIYTEVVDRELIRLRLHDNSSGIPVEVEKLFDPFFTTKLIG